MSEDKKKKKKKKKNPDFPFKIPPFDDEEEEEEYKKRMFEIFGESFSKNMSNMDFNKIIQDLFRNMKFDPSKFQNLGKIDNKQLEKMFKENLGRMKKLGPIVFGFNMRFDKNGKPIIDSFGNVKPKKYGETEVKSFREPLVDIIDDDDLELIVVAEIPGVLKKNIELKANNKSITIIAYDEDNRTNLDIKENEERTPKYNTTVDLPCSINPDHAQASLKNGILEIRLEKIKSTGKKISVD